MHCWERPEALYTDLRRLVPSIGHQLRVLDLAVFDSPNEWRFGRRRDSGIPPINFAKMVDTIRASSPLLKVLRIVLLATDGMLQDCHVPVAASSFGGGLSSLHLTVQLAHTSTIYRYGLPYLALAKNAACLCNMRTDITFQDPFANECGLTTQETDHMQFKAKAACRHDRFPAPATGRHNLFTARAFHDLVHWMIRYVSVCSVLCHQQSLMDSGLILDSSPS